MSNNPQAFPVPSEIMQEPESDEFCFGMSLRDCFAAKAMQGLIVEAGKQQQEIIERAIPVAAAISYAMADAMLRERAK